MIAYNSIIVFEVLELSKVLMVYVLAQSKSTYNLNEKVDSYRSIAVLMNGGVMVAAELIDLDPDPLICEFNNKLQISLTLITETLIITDVLRPILHIVDLLCCPSRLLLIRSLKTRIYIIYLCSGRLRHLKQLYLLDKHPYSALFVAPSRRGLFRT